MKMKQIALTGCLSAGLLLGSLAPITPAYADTTLGLVQQGSGVTASGVYSQNGLPLGGTLAFLTVKDSAGKLYHADQLSTDKDGRYKFQWTMPATASNGTYIAEIHIQGDVESRPFNYAAPLSDDRFTRVDDGPYRFTGELNAGAKQALVYNGDTGLNYTITSNTTEGNAANALVDATKANSRITSSPSGTTYLTVSIPSDTPVNHITVPGSVIRQMATTFGVNAHLLVATSVGSFDLPLGAVHSTLLDNVKTKPDGALKFTIQRVTATRSNQLSSEYQALGTSPLLLPVEFSLSALYGGQTLPITDFGDRFVRVSLDLTGATLRSGNTPSAQFLEPQSRRLSPTPSVLFRDAVGHGKLVVTRTGTGLYVPIENRKQFDDTTWSSTADKIHTLAAKAVISGKSPSKYDPNGAITRAEFATLMVRSLGLSDKQGSSQFYDVPLNSWFAGNVNIGSSLGLIAGYTPNQFAPDDQITREQMAALLARSLNYVQSRPYVDTTRVLGQIADASTISGWAREDVALAIHTGILPNSGRIDPGRAATRAESADMLYNLLSYLKFL